MLDKTDAQSPDGHSDKHKKELEVQEDVVDFFRYEFLLFVIILFDGLARLGGCVKVEVWLLVLVDVLDGLLVVIFHVSFMPVLDEGFLLVIV